jgi:hydroxyethylthiazole kinase-like uncharacterized protein yjeF
MPRGGDKEGSEKGRGGQPPVLIYTRDAVREVDRRAVEEYGIPSIVLMENAAFHLADIALAMVAEEPGAGVLIFCGPGNNGGDGLAAARHLHNAGAQVAVVMGSEGEAYRGDAAVNLEVVRRMGLPLFFVKGGDAEGAVRRAQNVLSGVRLVVDAILGTGASGAVRPPLDGLIEAVNALGGRGVPVLSADIPSGLDAQTGEPLGSCVRAAVTVSFVGLKQGFTALAAQPFLGDVVIADIGAPRELVERLGSPLPDHELSDREGSDPPTRPQARRPGDEGGETRGANSEEREGG